jgi:hypothetical protein
MYVRRIEEHPGAGRLGRHVRHDPRSLAYRYRARTSAAVVSVVHDRLIPILDQGSLGSCTGNAAEGALGCAPFYATLPTDSPGRPTADADADERQAVALYSAATEIDTYSGAYPPTDTGSDGLSVAKACEQAGLIAGYQHCTSIDEVLAALAERPLITGVNWYSSFDTPDENGILGLPKKAKIRGGHEFVIREIDADRELLGADQSWGLSYGLAGRFYIPFKVYERLLGEDGDATVFVPLDQPAPTPTPDPGNGDLLGCLGQIAALVKKAQDLVKGDFRLT